jgi:hypothetical protein
MDHFFVYLLHYFVARTFYTQFLHLHVPVVLLLLVPLALLFVFRRKRRWRS